MSDLPDRVAMGLTNAGFREALPVRGDEHPVELIRRQKDIDNFAAALSSHGLREFVEAAQALIDGSRLVASGTTYVPRGRFERFEKALAAVADPPTVKGEK